MTYRDKVEAFGAIMLSQFEANRDRGGYRAADPIKAQVHALDLLEQSKERLINALCGHLDADDQQRAAIREAAADVANCALMCADNAGVIGGGV